jgi:predicted MPP superfamily phosphohydrolase
LKGSRISRRNFLTGAVALGCVGVTGVAAYSRDLEPHELSIERHDVFLPRINEALDGFKIALLSDMHYGDYVQRVLQAAVQKANLEKPDITLLAGDFVTWHHDRPAHLASDADACARILSDLRPRFGTFAVLGNHDYSLRPSIVMEALKAHRIRLLMNESVPVERNGSRIWLTGGEDVLRGKPDIQAAMKGLPASEPKLVLVHEPDYADEVSRGAVVDLQLSGHSHGGQVRLPLIGAPVLPELAWKYPMGFYRVNNMQLYTNRGLGMSAPRVRFDCPPELTLLTLRRKQATA